MYILINVHCHMNSSMEYMVTDEQQNYPPHLIVCCQCGTAIEPNPANTCVACLRTLVDITEGIPKQATLYFCKGCERYLQPPSTWLSAPLESRELLAICLKRLKGLNKVHLVDAGFIWTEPHSKRVKVKLTVQKEVFSGAILQQVFVVEYIVHGQMCDECHRREAKDYWNSVVQVRQKVSHKKTLFYLEQLLLKHQAHNSALRVKGSHYGLDFFYAHKQEAVKLVDFLVAAIPCHSKASQELISHDTHNNTYNYKHTFSVEIVPVCKDSLVCLPRKLSQLLGNINQLVLCYRITSCVQLVDPQSTQTVDLNSQVFWRMPFVSLCEQQQLVEFFVIQIEPTSVVNNKFVLADCWVTKLRDLGTTGHQIHTRTHLGHLLHPGDTVLGYDLTTTNINDTNYERMKSTPDIVLVRKVYGDRGKRHRTRNWKLQQLNKEVEENMDTGNYDRDYKDFLDDLEEDKEYRQQVNIYFDPSAESRGANERRDLDDDIPTIQLDEMLDGLTLHDKA